MDLIGRLGMVPLLVKAVGGTYVERMSRTYEAAVVSLREQGVAAVLINNAARQAGMASAPLSPMYAARAPARMTPQQWQQLAAQVTRLKNLLLIVQAEGAMRCLKDGVVATPLDADVGAVLGCGFPMHFGGPIGYVDTVGAERFLGMRQAMDPAHPIDPWLGRRLGKQVEMAARFHGD